jgi:hypothetical protein
VPKQIDRLNLINVTSPCSADWDSMIGNEQVRFCSHCNLHVHNLSAMTRTEAMELVAKSKGRLCARFHRRPDGTVQTAPGQLHHIARRTSRIAAGAFSAVLSIAANAAAQSPAPSDELVQGGMRLTMMTDDSRQATADQLSAAIVGQVFDPQQASIAGATVTLMDQRTGQEQTTTSNEEGGFRFQSLAAGFYTLRVSAQGFMSNVIENAYLQENAEQRIDVKLEVPALMGDVVMLEPNMPLVRAAWENNLAAVRELLVKGADVNGGEDPFGTALMQAVVHGNKEMVHVLLWAGADVHAQSSNGNTALMYAGHNGTAEVVRALIAAGAQLELRDAQGNTPLLIAASQDNVEVLQAMLAAGADQNATTREGRTALMLAAEVGLVNNVKALIDAGAHINAQARDGSTALSYARRNGCLGVVELLQSYGAIE